MPHGGPTIGYYRGGAMGTISKLPSGKWRAQVKVGGARQSSSHMTRAAAMAWIVDREKLLAQYGVASTYTLHDVLRRYRDSAVVSQRGAEVARGRINRMLKHDLRDVRLADLRAHHISEWRDARLLGVSSSTVAREFNVVRAALNLARREWGWIHEDVFARVTAPKQGRPRSSIWSVADVEKMVAALGGLALPPETPAQQMAVQFLFALETGMRRGEIMAVRPEHIRGRALRVETSKNGDARDVPLTTRAVELAPHLAPPENHAAMLTAWKRAKRLAGLEQLTFHDARHTAATRHARKLHLLELCRMFGWRNPKQAMTYYNESAEAIAARLD